MCSAKRSREFELLTDEPHSVGEHKFGSLKTGQHHPQLSGRGDGSVDVSDLLVLLGMWGPCPGCDADLDGSGVVDVSDLLTLIANWGPCP